MIAEAAHACGDPGMQFDTTINYWHTCPASGRINASNPCSEYMHLDNSACNLASLNLMKFIDDRGEFDVRAFRHAVDVMITAQDILVDNSSYPTDEIGRNAARSASRAGLRESRRAADGARDALRLGPGPQLCRRDHRADDRRGLSAIGAYRRADGAVRGLRAESRADAAE